MTAMHCDCISNHGSERATSSFGNRIVTLDGKVHVTWQDTAPPGAASEAQDAHYKKPYADYPAQVRTLDLSSGEWSPTVTLAMGQDNHGRPTMIADSAGHLHVILGGHHTVMRHFRSTAPNDSSKWELIETFGRNTYPVVVSGPDDTFYLLARHDEQWQGTDLYIRRPDGKWNARGLLITREPQHVGYGAFPGSIAVAPNGVLHYVTDFYEGSGIHDARGLKQAIAAMRSLDGGRSWQRADGTPVPIPARPQDMDVLELHRSSREHEPMGLLIGHGCIGLDSQHRPHVFYVAHIRKPGEMMLASPDDGGTWRKRVIGPAVTGFPNHRPKGECRGRFVLTADNTMHLIVSLYPLDHSGWENGRPTERLKFTSEQHPIVRLTSKDLGETWSTEQLKPPVEDGLIQELNMERCSVHRPIAGRDPSYIFFDGLSRYPGAEEVIRTNVYFAQG